MKMNACKRHDQMWNIAQPSDSKICDPNRVTLPNENRPCAAHQCDQDEYHFARVHVAEQTQCEGIGLAIRLRFQQQVNRHAPLAERLQCQLAHETAEALHLYAIEQHQREYSESHAERGVGISRRGTTLKNGTPRNVITPGTQSMGIRSISSCRTPEENGQRQRSNHVVLGEKEPRTLVSTNSTAHSQKLQSARCTADCFLGHAAEYQ